MCGIAGIIYKNGDGAHRIGRDITSMLQAMKHRGPDSTGVALYHSPGQELIMRIKLADANTPRDLDFADDLRRHRSEVESRLRAAGAEVRSIEDVNEYTLSATLVVSRRRQAPRRLCRVGAERRSAVGRPRARDRQGPRRRQDGGVRLRPRRLLRLPRHRPRADGHRVRRRHLQRPPVLGLSVLRRRRRPQRPADELPPVAPAARARRPSLCLGVRFGDHRRVPGSGGSSLECRSRTRCA